MVVTKLASGIVALLLLVVTASPAAAGGAVWRFDRAAYRPGEVATAVTAIAWTHNPDLGTPDDGPYKAYVIAAAILAESDGGGYPAIPEAAVPVGDLEIGLGPIEESPGFLVGPNHARVRFVVPALPDGTYDLLHCNVPCTTPLADITWGQFVIGSPSPTTTITTTTTSPPTTSPPTTSPTTEPASSAPSTAATRVPTEQRDDQPSIALAIGGGTVAAAALLAGALRRRR